MKTKMWHLLHMYYYKTRNLLVQETGLKQKSKQKKKPKTQLCLFLTGPFSNNLHKSFPDLSQYTATLWFSYVFAL